MVEISPRGERYASRRLQLFERRSEAREDLLRVAEAYTIQVTNIRDRAGLTGTPLGIGRALKLFIQEIAFVNIWPNKQAR